MKNVLKQCIFILSALIVCPLTLVYLLLSVVMDKDSLIATFSQVLTLIPGKTGAYLRSGFYRFSFTYCHPNAVISFMVLFSQFDTEIEQGVYIGPQSNIGRCRIGENTLIGSGVHIMSGKGQHNFDDLTSPIKDQGGEFQKISIGKNCWLGNGSLVMANIGDGCIVGAGSVVINDIPAYSIIAGNPAKVIKNRLP